jgi:biopolymer transport protein ExbD
MLLLIFFLLTWNAARNENELDVKIPKATQAKEKVRADRRRGREREVRRQRRRESPHALRD